jgi:hypothetical protein
MEWIRRFVVLAAMLEPRSPLLKFYNVENDEINFHGGSMRGTLARLEQRTKTSGKTSCPTKTRRYSKAVCSTQRD